MLRIAFFASLLPALAAAAPPSLGGDDTVVLVSVPGVEAAGEPRAAGDRIELDVAPGVTTSKTYYGSDPTVRKVEILAAPAPRISVQLRRSRATIELLAGATRVLEEDGKVVLRIPRDKQLIAAAAPPAAPEPPAITVEPAAVQVKTVAAAPPPAVVETAPPPRLTGGPAQPAPTIGATAPALTGAPAGEQSATPGRLLLLGAILCACGAAALVARRRRDVLKKPGAPANIEVLASRQLGGKTRAVLLSVNDSQMLLAVSDHGARLLGQWFADEDGGRIADRELSFASPLLPVPDAGSSSPDTEPQVPVGVRRPSAAVAGLIKLRREGDARFAGDVARALRASRR